MIHSLRSFLSAGLILSACCQLRTELSVFLAIKKGANDDTFLRVNGKKKE